MIHEPLEGWWHVSYILSLGNWDGRSDDFLDKGQFPFRLRVHFTANLLGEQFGCRLWKSHQHHAPTKSWRRRPPLTNNRTEDISQYILEDGITSLERSLLRLWLQQAEAFQRSVDSGATLGDGEINWTEFGRGMGWSHAEYKLEDNSLEYSAD